MITTANDDQLTGERLKKMGADYNGTKSGCRQWFFHNPPSSMYLEISMCDHEGNIAAIGDLKNSTEVRIDKSPHTCGDVRLICLALGIEMKGTA